VLHDGGVVSSKLLESSSLLYIGVVLFGYREIKKSVNLPKAMLNI